MKLFKLDDDTFYNIDLIYKIERNKNISNQQEINSWKYDADNLYHKMLYEKNYVNTDEYKKYQREYINKKSLLYDVENRIINKMVIDKIGECPKPKYSYTYTCYFIDHNIDHIIINEDQYNEICKWK